MPNTLSFRLTFGYTLAVVLLVGTTLFALYMTIDSVVSQRMDHELLEDIQEFTDIVRYEGVEVLQEVLRREVRYEDPSDFFLRLFDDRGRQLFSSDIRHWGSLPTDHDTVQRRLQLDPTPIMQTQQFADHRYATRMVYSSVGPGLYLQIGESMEEAEEIMRLLRTWFLVIFAVAIPLASVAAWLMARQAAGGVEAITHAVAAVGQGNLGLRVEVFDQRDEIQQLALSFNAMSGRIVELVREMREMTDNIAHDLRSPLTRIRAIAESAISGSANEENYRNALADTLEECDRLMRLINMTLDVAEAEAGVAITRSEEVDVGELAREACDIFEAVAEQNEISLTANIEGGARLRGDRPRLQRMVGNLLDNALKYTPPGGSVDVSVRTDADGLHIAVADTGVGIPANEQARIFERFYRCDQSRTQHGFGLGLSFSRAVAHAHGGDIRVTSEPNRSSCFDICFPARHTTN